MPQVAQAQASKNSISAKVTLNEALADAILADTAACGGKYTVTGVE